MSTVTDVILVSSVLEKTTQLNHYLANVFAEQAQPPLVCVDSVEDGNWYGGGKHLQTKIRIGAFNYLDIEALVTAVKAYPWEDPESVQLLISEEETSGFEVVVGSVPTNQRYAPSIDSGAAFATWCATKGLTPERCDEANIWIRYAFEAGAALAPKTPVAPGGDLAVEFWTYNPPRRAPSVAAAPRVQDGQAKCRACSYVYETRRSACPACGTANT